MTTMRASHDDLIVLYQGRAIQGTLRPSLRLFADDPENPCEALVLDEAGNEFGRFTPSLEAIVTECAEHDVIAAARQRIESLEALRSSGALVLRPHLPTPQTPPEPALVPAPAPTHTGILEVGMILVAAAIIAVSLQSTDGQMRELQARTYESQMKSELLRVENRQLTFFDNHDRFASTPTELGFTPSPEVTLQIAGATRSGYTAVASRTNTEKVCTLTISLETERELDCR